LEERDIEDLIATFYERRFGFAYVKKGSGIQPSGFADLRDVVGLYDKSMIKTDLLVGDVASYPLIRMPGDSSMKEALDMMLRKNVRRMVVSGTNGVISDREIIDHIVTAYRPGENSSNLLDAKLRDLKSVIPSSVELGLPLGRAAHIVYEDCGCLLCGDGIVTPWDLVVKPWLQDKLSTNE
jgi:CBS domain-containing protein